MTAVASPGDSRTAALEELTRTMIVQYAGAAGDFSPLHVDEPAAIAAGHSSVMGHGMWTLAQAAGVVAEWFGAEAILDLQARFTAPVWPGDRLRVHATITTIEETTTGPVAEVALTSSNDEELVVLTGIAKVCLDQAFKRDGGPRWKPIT